MSFFYFDMISRALASQGDFPLPLALRGERKSVVDRGVEV